MSNSEAPLLLDYSHYVEGMRYVDQNSIQEKAYYTFGQLKKCPFCSSDLVYVASEFHNPTYETELSNDAIQCKQCGWWRVTSKYYDHDGGYDWTSRKCRYASLTKHKIDSIDLPLSTLAAYIKRNPKRIHSADKTRTEKLVGSVFADFFDCEVAHVGGVKDGGVDLFFVHGDSDYFVQVKNREIDSRNWKCEPVDTVRNCLAATQLEQFRFNQSRSIALVVCIITHFFLKPVPTFRNTL